MSGRARIDVVIPTRDRPGPLEALLGDLEVQTHPPESIVIVDDGREGRPATTDHPELPIRSVRVPERGFITRAKNRGAREGTSEYIAFIDDDNRVPPILLGSLARDLADHPRRVAVMPGVLYHARPDLVWVYATPFRPDRWEFELIGRNRPRDPRWEGRILATDALPNLSLVRREAFEKVGGFDASFPVNSSGDLSQRLMRAGGEVVADTGILTRHDVEPPGTRAFWGAHTVPDPERTRHEVADWFRFHRRWGPRPRGFSTVATYHALAFLVPLLIAMMVRSGPPRRSLLGAVGRGYLEGLVGPIPDTPAPPYRS